MAEQNKKQKTKPDSEQARLKKEEQARNARRRNRQFIGVALVILVAVGAVSIVRAGINLAVNLLNSDEDKAVYQKRFEPFVWFDILPFESVAQVDENAVKQVAIWGILSEKGDTVDRNENGEPLISQIDMDQYGVQLFGPDFRFRTHEPFQDAFSGLTYRFDEETRMYTVPVTSLQPGYYATVVDILREPGGVRRVVMGYVSTRTGDDQLVPTLDYEHPARYMDFMLRRDGRDYYLYAILNNTTHIPQQPTQSTPVSSLPDLSMPPSSQSQPETPPQSGNTGRPEGGEESAAGSSVGEENSSTEVEDSSEADSTG